MCIKLYKKREKEFIDVTSLINTLFHKNFKFKIFLFNYIKLISYIIQSVKKRPPAKYKWFDFSTQFFIKNNAT